MITQGEVLTDTVHKAYSSETGSVMEKGELDQEGQSR